MKKQQMLRLAETMMMVPTGTISDTPRFELCGRDRLRIEGRCEMRGCEQDGLLLNTGVGAVRLSGHELSVVLFGDSGGVTLAGIFGVMRCV